MRISTLLLILCTPLALTAGDSFGHEGHAHREPSSGGAGNSLPAGMVLPEIEGPRPWSAKPVLNDPNRFQFAIMTDRTGGHRPGVWMDAVRKLNLLRPEFVVSVGDLIEGYTQDRAEVERQWEEFLGFIDQLEMRFFFVAGNHDLSNRMMHAVWRKRFGKAWYSFDYKDVHFVCLLSEDPVDRIGDEQLEWIRDDLSAHRDARWTLVFLHKPLWVYAERELAAGNRDATNWREVESLLVDRPHTIFAGHVHHYVQYQRNNQQYYSLATTGGGSMLRGNQYGEFDHVTWLTMEADGPHVANLRLDGILRPDVVTEEGVQRFNKFLAGTGVEVAPILIEGDETDAFSQGEVVLRVRNDFEEGIDVLGEIDGMPLRGITVDPAKIAAEVGPGNSVEQRIRIEFTEPVPFAMLQRTTYTAKVRTRGDDPLSAEVVVPVVIDRKFSLPSLAAMPELDGVIDEWPTERTNSIPDNPLLTGNVRSWQGAGDATAEFFARQVGDRAYVAVRVTDDRVMMGDGVELLVDPRPIGERTRDSQYGSAGLSIRATAPDEAGGSQVSASRLSDGSDYAGVQSAAKATDDGYDLEFSVPLSLVKRLQGDDWDSLQGTVVLDDVDEADDEPVHVFWRGSDRPRQVNTGFGHFVRVSE